MPIASAARPRRFPQTRNRTQCMPAEASLKDAPGDPAGAGGPAGKGKARMCALTGANGFVGRELKTFLERADWKVIPWVRRPGEGPGVEFKLGNAVKPQALAGVEALVHCAYDFNLGRWEDIARINVGGTRELLSAATEAGVPRIVLISSLSAFPGCRALYGRAKLEMEALTKAARGHIVRPGLVYGDNPGGVFGKLVRQVRGSRFAPVLAGG